MTTKAPSASPSSELTTAELLAEIKFFTDKIESIDKEQGAYIGFQVKAGEASGGEDIYLQHLVLRRAAFIEVVCKLTKML